MSIGDEVARDLLMQELCDADYNAVLSSIPALAHHLRSVTLADVLAENEEGATI